MIGVDLNMAQHIAIIEDELDIQKLLALQLAHAGYTTSAYGSGKSCLDDLVNQKTNLILLDLMLPDIDGHTLCQILKGKSSSKDIPIIILSAKGGEQDIIRGLEEGADDYITKPFSAKVLLARIRSVLRRHTDNPLPQKETQLAVHDLTMNVEKREAFILNRLVQLTRSEFDILYYLAKRPGWVFTRNQIVDAIRGLNYAVTSRSIDVQIVSIRKKLSPHEAYIETVRGIGYRFKE